MVSLLGVGLIEALGAYLEAQLFHSLIYVVVALEYVYGQVAKRIVAFRIINPKQ